MTGVVTTSRSLSAGEHAFTCDTIFGEGLAVPAVGMIDRNPEKT